MSDQVGFTHDVNQCISCRSCEMACKVEYNLAAGEGRRRRVIERTVVEGSKIRTFFISLACNHCENPACLAACPDSTVARPSTIPWPAGKKALYKTTAADAATYSSGLVGVVRLNPDKCIACRRCEWACPYGAPQYDPNGGSAGIAKVHKCEFCHERIGAWKTAHGRTDWYNPTGTAQADHAARSDKRRQTACAATCLGRALESTLVNPSVSTSENRGPGSARNYVDYADYVPIGTDVCDNTGARNRAARAFESPGTAGRGSEYLTDWSMTHPALKICNRRYKNRGGGSS